jgi:hypothetical protein
MFGNEGEVYIGEGDQLRATQPYHAWLNILDGIIGDPSEFDEVTKIFDNEEKEYLPLLNQVLPLNLTETSKYVLQFPTNFLRVFNEFSVTSNSYLDVECKHFQVK